MRWVRDGLINSKFAAWGLTTVLPEILDKGFRSIDFD